VPQRPIALGSRPPVEPFREYSPWISASLSDAYLDFLAETVRPLLRFACHGRILDAPEHSMIMGSSLGALISRYACFQQRDVVGRCGAMSPPTWQGSLVPSLAKRQHH
jgi:predicted alpha/beta superfamily hydrolase